MGKISDLNTRTNTTIPKELKKLLQKNKIGLLITTLKDFVSNTQK